MPHLHLRWSYFAAGHPVLLFNTVSVKLRWSQNFATKGNDIVDLVVAHGGQITFWSISFFAFTFSLFLNICSIRSRVWHPGPGNSRSREFCSFLDGTGTGTGKNWSRKKVPVPVPEKFGPGKKYRYRYRKNLVPEKSTGTGTGENWSRKKVPVPVSEKIGPGTVEFPGTPGHCIF